MRRRGKLLLSIAALTVGLVAILLTWNRASDHGLGPSVPIFQGKTIEAWADLGIAAAMAHPQDLPNALLASNAIHQIGAPAIGWIGAMIPKHTDLTMQLGSRILLPDAIKDPIADGAIQDVRRALFVLYALDGATTPYVCEVPTNWVLTPSYAAGVVGTAALPVVIPALTNGTSVEIKDRLLTSIVHWGSDARRAGPLLWERWEQNTMPTDRNLWLLALSATGYRADELAGRLMAKLTNTPANPPEREATLSQLAVMGRPGSEALLSLLHHPDRTLQQQAFCALFQRRRTESKRAVIPTIGGSSGNRWASSLSDDVPESSWSTLAHSAVAIRVRAAELAMERRFHPERFATNEPVDIVSILQDFRRDPDPAVSRIAANALDGAVFFPGR